MNINDRLYAVYLIDYYGPLLTEHQLAILNEYYDNDLSMQEIAENHQISKSAVADIIKRSFNQLQTYENKLHFIRFFPVLIFSSSPKLNFFISAPAPTAIAATGVANFNI